MSQYLYPSLQGQSIEVTKTAIWKGIIQKVISGKEVRTRLWSYPLYGISLKYNFLTDKDFNINVSGIDSSDFETLLSFYNMVGGTFDNFLYLDPVDYTVTDETIGTADNSETQFQLTRSILTWTEPIFAIKVITNIKVGGTPTTDYTVNDFGLVTFNTAPSSGVITWTGEYYFRCRFAKEEIDFDRFLNNLYNCGSVDLITVKV